MPPCFQPPYDSDPATVPQSARKSAHSRTKTRPETSEDTYVNDNRSAWPTLTSATIKLVHAGGQASSFASAHDPGVRTDAVDAGQPLANLSQTPGASEFFTNGQARFEDVEVVQGGVNNGLGPRFNSNQCSSCHSQPNVGGSSPSASVYPFVGLNPETLVFNVAGATNALPSFITADGPVREARFVHFLNPNGTLSTTARWRRP